jgi:uroporphyrinogen decarboxylase
MEHQSVDRVPNWELGVWAQTRERWIKEGLPEGKFKWNWFFGEDAIGLDRREFVPVNMGMIPAFEHKVIEETERYEVIRRGDGRITKALKEGSIGGARMSMDQYLRFPVETIDDLRDMKKRYDPTDPRRYPKDWRDKITGWNHRDHVLILGLNCCTGFYGVARAWMGTEKLSLAFYDQPKLCEEMFQFIADFLIEVSTPILKEVEFDYFNFFEDLAFKSAPLVSPACFRKFIFPHYRRAIDHLKKHGVKYVSLDSDGNTEVLIPMFLEMGVDVHWPFERAADMDPVRIKAQYGNQLRIWGGVDKREIAKGQKHIDGVMRELAPLIENGGFIPTLDHTFPPDISWENFCYYMEQKEKLLEGKFSL